MGIAMALAAAVLLAVLAPQMLSKNTGQRVASQAPYDRQEGERKQPTARPTGRGVADSEPDPPQPPAQTPPTEAALPHRAPEESPAPRRKPRPTQRDAGNGLAQEQAVLARAADALAEGRHTDARAELDEHERRFPDGKLATERQALRMILRCTLAAPDARSAAVRFIEDNPETLMAAKVRARCGLGQGAANQ
jgi:TolA-binding protein